MIAMTARIDDCSLVSAGRGQVDTLWIFTNGHDAFVALGGCVTTPRRYLGR
jgi:hypothetical protein